MTIIFLTNMRSPLFSTENPGESVSLPWLYSLDQSTHLLSMSDSMLIDHNPSSTICHPASLALFPTKIGTRTC